MVLGGNDPAVLKVPMIQPSWTNDRFGISLSTRSGRVYALEYKNSLADGNWTMLPLTAGNGGVLTLTDPAATSVQRFYRVRQW
jgi:hypothetical protein